MFQGFCQKNQVLSRLVWLTQFGSILTLARLDAFIAIIVSYLRDDGTDSVGSRRLKAYHGNFVSFLSLTLSQLTECIERSSKIGNLQT